MHAHVLWLCACACCACVHAVCGYLYVLLYVHGHVCNYNVLVPVVFFLCVVLCACTFYYARGVVQNYQRFLTRTQVVMEYVDGGSLTDVIECNPYIPEPIIAAVCKEVYMHEHTYIRKHIHTYASTYSQVLTRLFAFPPSLFCMGMSINVARAVIRVFIYFPFIFLLLCMAINIYLMVNFSGFPH